MLFTKSASFFGLVIFFATKNENLKKKKKIKQFSLTVFFLFDSSTASSPKNCFIFFRNSGSLFIEFVIFMNFFVNK